MKLTVTALRHKYPHPLRAKQASGYVETEYCVGGAFCKEMGVERHGCNFPTSEEVQQAAQKANPAIDRNLLTERDFSKFVSICDKVIAANDVGSFDVAWDAVRELLHWKPKLMTIEEICERAEREG